MWSPCFYWFCLPWPVVHVRNGEKDALRAIAALNRHPVIMWGAWDAMAVTESHMPKIQPMQP